MYIEKIKLIKTEHLTLFQNALKFLGCNTLWILQHDAEKVNIITTDLGILRHYCIEKYYLTDPTMNQGIKNLAKVPFSLSIGTDMEEFKANGFLYELYKMFHVTEFITINITYKSKIYSFRFFSKHNKFTFLNTIMNNVIMIQKIITNIIIYLELKQPIVSKVLNVVELQLGGEN